MTIAPELFGARLRECLAAKGVCSHTEQVRCVAKAAAVTPRTAARYVLGASYPRYLDDRLGRLAEFLGVLPVWLVSGEGPRTQDESEDMMRFAETVQNMSPHYRSKLGRALILMLNGSPRERRLMHLVRSGQLSWHDYLDLV